MLATPSTVARASSRDRARWREEVEGTEIEKLERGRRRSEKGRGGVRNEEGEGGEAAASDAVSVIRTTWSSRAAIVTGQKVTHPDVERSADPREVVGLWGADLHY
jgi:hypothetical protein